MKLQQEATAAPSACWRTEVDLCLLCVLRWSKCPILCQRDCEEEKTTSLTLWQSSSISPNVHQQSIPESSFPLLIFYIHITSLLCYISNRSSSCDLPPRVLTRVFTTRETSEVRPVIELQNCWQPGNADQRAPPVAVLMVNFHFLYVFPHRATTIPLLLFPRCSCSALMCNVTFLYEVQNQCTFYYFYWVLPFNKIHIMTL